MSRLLSLRGAARLLIVLAVLPVGAGEGQRSQTTKQRWQQVRTGSCVVSGPISERRLAIVGDRCLELEQRLNDLSGFNSGDRVTPARIIVFENERDLQPLRTSKPGSTGSEPLMHRDREGLLIVLSSPLGEEVLDSAALAVARNALAAAVPALPDWLRSGLAAWISASRAEPLLTQLRSDATPDTATRRSLRVVGHLLSDPNRNAQLRRALRLFRASTPSPFALDEAFASDRVSLEREALERPAKPPRWDLPADSVLSVRDLRQSEILVEYADLILRMAPWDTPEAETLYRQIDREDPLASRATSGVARARELDGRDAEARLLFEESLASGQSDPILLLRAGWSALEHHRRSTGTLRSWDQTLPASLHEAHTRCERAQELAPDLSAATHCAAAALLFLRQPPDYAVATLVELARADGAEQDHRIRDAILALAHSGQFAEAAHLQRTRATPSSASDIAAVHDRIVEDALARATWFVDRNLLDQAVETLATASAFFPSSELDAAAAEIRELNHRIAHEQLVAKHNRAAELLRSGRFDEARKLAHEVLNAGPAAELEASIRRILAALPAP